MKKPATFFILWQENELEVKEMGLSPAQKQELWRGLLLLFEDNPTGKVCWDLPRLQSEGEVGDGFAFGEPHLFVVGFDAEDVVGITGAAAAVDVGVALEDFESL